MLLVPMEELHDMHIGLRLLTSNLPPLDSATIWPHEKLSFSMSTTLQHKHFATPLSLPIHLHQTCFLKI